MYFERSNVRSLLVLFTANFCNLSCFLVTYSTTYHYCSRLLSAPFIFLVHFLEFGANFSVIFHFFVRPFYLFNRLSFLLLFPVCTIYIFGAKFINLVQICLKNSHYNFFGAACIYPYFYVPVQFATFLSGCILVIFSVIFRKLSFLVVTFNLYYYCIS